MKITEKFELENSKIQELRNFISEFREAENTDYSQEFYDKINNLFENVLDAMFELDDIKILQEFTQKQVLETLLEKKDSFYAKEYIYLFIGIYIDVFKKSTREIKNQDISNKIGEKLFLDIYNKLSEEEKYSFDLLTNYIEKYNIFLKKVDNIIGRDYIGFDIFVKLYEDNGEKLFEEDYLEKVVTDNFSSLIGSWNSYRYRSQIKDFKMSNSIEDFKNQVKPVFNILDTKQKFFYYLSYLYNKGIYTKYLTTRGDSNSYYFDKYSGRTTTFMDSVMIEDNLSVLRDLGFNSEVNEYYQKGHVGKTIEEKVSDYFILYLKESFGDNLISFGEYLYNSFRLTTNLEKEKKNKKLEESRRFMEKQGFLNEDIAIIKVIAGLKENYNNLFSSEFLDMKKLSENEFIFVWPDFKSHINGSEVKDDVYMKGVHVKLNGDDEVFISYDETYMRDFRTTSGYTSDIAFRDLNIKEYEKQDGTLKLIVSEDCDYELYFLPDATSVYNLGDDLSLNYDGKQEVEIELDLKDLDIKIQEQIIDKLKQLEDMVLTIGFHKFTMNTNRDGQYKAKVQIEKITKLDDDSFKVDFLYPKVDPDITKYGKAWANQSQNNFGVQYEQKTYCFS